MNILSRNHLWKEVVVRIVFPAIVFVGLYVLAMFCFILPTMRENIIARKKEMIKELVQAGWSTLMVNHEQEQKGELTRLEAQRRATYRLRYMRYGKDLKDYFWINDTQRRMVLHPYLPELEGQDLHDYTDPTGEHIFVRFAEVAEQQGEGYVQYMWQWKDDPRRVVPKLSFVKLFQPWGWVLGTGVYIEDVDAEIAAFTWKLTAVVLAILAVAIISLSFIIGYGVRTGRLRRLAEESLDRERNFSRRLIDTAQAIILVLDPQCRIVTFNKYTEKLTGYSLEEVKGKCWIEVFIHESQQDSIQEAFEKTLRGIHSQGYINPITVRDGREIFIEWYDDELKDADGKTFGILAIGRDVTARLQSERERRQLQEQLHQAQKMEAIGQLASGIAHDFSNLLMVIMGNLANLRRLTTDNPPAQRELDMMAEAVEQASGITKSLLTFSRRLPTEMKSQSVAEIVETSAQMLRRLLPAVIDLRVEIDENTRPTRIKGDSAQLQQVILNLALNARDAMPKGGTLRIATSLGQSISDQETTDTKAHPIDGVWITVTDTGTGMPQEMIERIYEPFYSTKPRGQGTGLGLAIVLGIVQGHGGRIEVDSEVGRGTCFKVWLPILHAEEQDTAASFSDQQVSTGRGQRILLAEDHPYVRQIMATSLEADGYRVTSVADGDAAMLYYRANADTVDLLVTDMDLPGRSGIACLREMRADGFRRPAILISGSVGLEVEEQLDEYTLLLRKPFQMADLNRLVGNLLQGVGAVEAES